MVADDSLGHVSLILPPSSLSTSAGSTTYLIYGSG